jgi:predicted phage tail protein
MKKRLSNSFFLLFLICLLHLFANPKEAQGQVLSATVVSYQQVNLSWPKFVHQGDTVQVEYKRVGMHSNFIPLATVKETASGTQLYEDKNAADGVQILYRLKYIYWESGMITAMPRYSNEITVTTPGAPPNLPASPAALTAKANLAFQIELHWIDRANNEYGFEIERSTDNNNFAKIASPVANTTQYLDGPLMPATRYYYRVRALNRAGASRYSDVAETTTFDVPPAAPELLAATTISGSQINLTWKDMSANETGFQLERSMDGAAFTKIADLSANTTAYQNTGLSAATKYWFRVRAVNTTNPSAFSNVANATTLDVIPLAPENLVATVVNYGQIDLAWVDKSKNEEGFQLERSTDGTSFTKIADIAGNVVSYQDKTAASLTKYYYRLRAINTIGNSAYTNVAIATTPKEPIPDKPQNLTAIPVDFDLIQLKWSALSQNATAVVIERSDRADQGFVQIGNQAAAIIQFEDREILPINDYFYRIKAVNVAGSSPYSDVVKVDASAIITDVEPMVSNDDLIYVSDRILHVKRTSAAEATLILFGMNGANLLHYVIGKDFAEPLAGLPSGIYVVVIESDKGIYSKKVLVR